ncbi:MAG: NAD+ synthase [Methanobacteriaceae archaeon]|jgi:NAD+ synthase|nr:NAD+ synthase [Candidatus Methanorudis spinitermitis]
MIELPKLNPDKTKDKIIDFIKSEKIESSVKGIAIGLSGGLDSTIVAYLLKEAIGHENIFGVHINTSTTPEEDKKHFKIIAENLNIKYKEIAIDNLSNDFINLVTDFSLKSDNPESEKVANVLINKRRYDEYIQKIAEGNLKSRIRMSILYYYANLNNFLVAGTTNRSELLIGYFTKYGDGAGDILPIANIYKSQLKKLAMDWNIPKEIINKPPRAGLWDGQTDEDEIGFSYEILDKLLHLIVDKKLDNDSISKEINISTEEINKIRDKIDNNKHKLQFPSSPVGI